MIKILPFICVFFAVAASASFLPLDPKTLEYFKGQVFLLDQETTKLNFSSNDNAYYFRKALSFFDIKNKNGEGEMLRKYTNTPTNSAEIFRVADIGASHDHPLPVAKLFIDDVLIADLSSSNIEKVYWAFKVLPIYMEYETEKITKGAKFQTAIKDALDNVVYSKLREGFKQKKGGKSDESELLNAARAVSILSIAHGVISNTNEKEKTLSFVPQVESLLATGVEVHKNTRQFFDRRLNSVDITAEIFEAAVKYAKLTKSNSLYAALIPYQNYLLSKAHASISSIKEIHHLLGALHASSAFPRVQLLSSKTGIEMNKPLKIRTKIINAFGAKIEAADGDKLHLTIIRKSDGKNLESNIEMKRSGDEFVYETTTLTKPGVHQLHFTFKSKVAGAERLADYTEEILVGVKGGLTKLEYQLSNSPDVPTKYANSINFQDQIKEQLSVDETSYLHVRVHADANVPNIKQLQIRLTHIKSGKTFVSYRKSLAQPNQYQLSFDFGSNSVIDSLNGQYTFEVIAADPSLLKPISWKLGEISVKFKGGSENAEELYNLHKAKPEIHYTAPAEESHPIGVFGVAFVVLMGFVFFIFIQRLLTQKLAFSNVPTNFIDYISSIAFMGCILALAVVSVMFWIEVTLAGLAKILPFIIIPGVIFGRRTLGAIDIIDPQEKRDTLID